MTTSATSNVKALLFDVFGTVVDWRTSIAREARVLLKAVKLFLAKRLDVYWGVVKQV